MTEEIPLKNPDEFLGENDADGSDPHTTTYYQDDPPRVDFDIGGVVIDCPVCGAAIQLAKLAGFLYCRDCDTELSLTIRAVCDDQQRADSGDTKS